MRPLRPHQAQICRGALAATVQRRARPRHMDVPAPPQAWEGMVVEVVRAQVAVAAVSQMTGAVAQA